MYKHDKGIFWVKVEKTNEKAVPVQMILKFIWCIYIFQRFSILNIVRHYTSGSMASVMMPKAAAKFIAENSEDIKINKDGVNNLAKVVSVFLSLVW